LVVEAASTSRIDEVTSLEHLGLFYNSSHSGLDNLNSFPGRSFALGAAQWVLDSLCPADTLTSTVVVHNVEDESIFTRGTSIHALSLSNIAIETTGSTGTDVFVGGMSTVTFDVFAISELVSIFNLSNRGWTHLGGKLSLGIDVAVTVSLTQGSPSFWTIDNLVTGTSLGIRSPVGATAINVLTFVVSGIPLLND
jgi:hypothetical protein